MTILYINDEHCTSMEQLHSYFEGSWSYESPVFCDLLDAARMGDISSWLREKGESNLADKVDCIDDKLGDSEYFSRLSALMTGYENGLDTFEKPGFSTCFKVEEVRQEETQVGMAVHVRLRVLSSVNETYELAVRTSWGSKGDEANPFNEKRNGVLTKSFTFRKRPNIDFKDVALFADGRALADVPCVGLGGDVLEFEVGSCCFKMIRVEHGSFMMGEDSDYKHVVTLTKDYYIGETQVTQALWTAVMRDNPSGFWGSDLPVERISWGDCQYFIRKLNIMTGKSFRLPTEAEWEFAARGGNKSNGYKYSGSDNIDEVAWHYDNSSRKSHPVKSKKANELGIYDMSGNVCEWCQDWYDYYRTNPQTDPQGPGSNSGWGHVKRGGSWNHRGGCCVKWRDSGTGKLKSYNGLRLALS